MINDFNNIYICAKIKKIGYFRTLNLPMNVNFIKILKQPIHIGYQYPRQNRRITDVVLSTSR